MPAENCTGLSHICCKRSAKHTKTAKISKQEIFILEKLSSRLCFSLTQSVFKLIEMDTKYIEEKNKNLQNELKECLFYRKSFSLHHLLRTKLTNQSKIKIDTNANGGCQMMDKTDNTVAKGST